MTYHKDGYVPTGKQDQGTPLDLFAALDAEFGFDLDAAANAENTLCTRYWTEDDDALKQSWAVPFPGAAYCNPPYGRGITEAFLDKGYRESEAHRQAVVMLVPAAVGSKWFVSHIVQRAAEIRFISGRLKFRGQPRNALFDCVVVVFDPRVTAQRVTWIDARGQPLLARDAIEEAA